MRVKSLFYVLMMLIISAPAYSVKITVKNRADIARTLETVTIEWADIVRKIPQATPENIRITDQGGKQLPSQVIYNGQPQPQSLIFQVTLPAKGIAEYNLTTGPREKYDVQAFGRFVPERMDDFAWENDRTAHRMYGPALQATGEISNGIDIWLKRTDRLVIDRWYAKGNDYHTDHGEGLDCYKVGRTLGAGAMAPYVGGRLWLAGNFTSYEVLDNGPVRISFRLEYAPFDVDGKTIKESRAISLDANTSFNRITETYTGDFKELPVAAGIVLRKPTAGDALYHNQKEGVLYYWEPVNIQNGDNGNTAVALLFNRPPARTGIEQGHLMATCSVTNATPFTYYMGAGWSKGGFENQAAWNNYVQNESRKLKSPLTVKIK